MYGSVVLRKRPTPPSGRSEEERLRRILELRRSPEERPARREEQPINQELTGTPGDPEAAQAKAVHQPGPTRSLRQRYMALLWRARLAGVAFWTAMAFFLAWAVPWIPSGLSVEDYSREVVLTFALAGSCMGLGLTALLLRRYAQRTQEALIAWSTVYDDTTGLYNRRYFYERLSLECDRAKVRGTSFAVLVLRLEDTGPRQRARSGSSESDILRTAADELARGTRSTDVAALLSGSELAVLLPRVTDSVAEEVAVRLARSVREALPTQTGPGVRLGMSTYGGDGRNPNSLLRAAQRDMKTRTRRAESLEQTPRAA